MGQPVRIRDVCRLAGDRTMSLTTSERIARKGPYPLYAENCSRCYIDDYALEAGGTVFVAAFGQVITSQGTLLTLLEEGRCSGTEHVHALVPHDHADARYIWRALSVSPKAARGVMGTSQLRELSGPALLSTPIPWPHKEVRDAFVEALDRADERAIELADLVPTILAEGDEAFAKIVVPSSEQRVACGTVAKWVAGTDVAARDRGPEKPVRVEGPHGRLGKCDEALVTEPSVVVGPAGRKLLAHAVLEPSHPIAEMRYVSESACDVPLSVLLFALRDAGVYDRLRLNGAAVDAPRLDVADLDALQIRIGTSEAREEFAKLGDELLERIARAQRDADENAENRYSLIVSYFTDDTMPGMSSELGDLPVARGESITKEKAKKVAAQKLEQAQEQAKEAGGIVIDEIEAAKLGPLRAIVESHTFGLEPADVAWELAPLAVIRACSDESQWASVREAAAGDAGSLVASLDAVMQDLAQTDDLLSFMPNLSYASSLLNPSQLAGWVTLLDEVAPDSIDAQCVRAVFMLEPGAAYMPDEVARIWDCVVASVSSAQGKPVETVYVPWESRGSALDSLSRVLPEATVRAQFDDFSNMLAGALVRAAGLKDDQENRGGLGAAAGMALTADEFPEWKAPIVTAAFPANPGEWIQGQPSADDPRWVLGKPPRNKANYAWIQHCLWHLEDEGCAVLLLANLALHSSVGSELTLREKLAASGRVRMVASLPSGLFSDGRPAMSIVVLSSPDPSARCLMVDALGLGEGFDCGGRKRKLSSEDVERVCTACSAWLERREEVEDKALAAVVDVAQIEAAGFDLCPWTYVRSC